VRWLLGWSLKAYSFQMSLTVSSKSLWQDNRYIDRILPVLVDRLINTWHVFDGRTFSVSSALLGNLTTSNASPQRDSVIDVLSVDTRWSTRPWRSTSSYCVCWRLLWQVGQSIIYYAIHNSKFSKIPSLIANGNHFSMHRKVLNSCS